VAARDGAAGHVHDLLFDDRRWHVRYLVVDVHQGLSHRQVLLSPVCVRYVDPVQRRLEVSLPRERILHGPGVETDRPVTRQHEVALHEYYGIPFYWTVDGSAPGGGGDPHLQSMRAVRGYTAIARDVAAGRLNPDKITERVFARYLYRPEVPEVDLFLRPSGEQRTSNFLVWQSAYAELVFQDTLWPDFDRRHFWHACEVFAGRDRRYGGAAPNPVPPAAG
jgi:hypothetical protein